VWSYDFIIDYDHLQRNVLGLCQIKFNIVASFECWALTPNPNPLDILIKYQKSMYITMKSKFTNVVLTTWNVKLTWKRLVVGRTGVFSWCVISWFYFPWNVNSENYSSWLVTWRFCVTSEKPEIFNRYSWFYHSILPDFETQVLRMVSRLSGVT